MEQSFVLPSRGRGRSYTCVTSRENYQKKKYTESVYVSFLTALMSLLDVLENICIYSHAIGLVTHMLDCRDLPSAGRASEGI